MKKVALLFILFANSAFCQTANTIPSKYHGTWDASVAHCKTDTSDGVTKITANAIEEWESSGKVTSVRQNGKNLIVELSLFGEGETWTDKRTLSRKGDKLVVNGALMVKCKTDNTKAHPIFTQAGLEDKPILRTCYRDPCSVARVMSYQVLENHTTNQLLKLNIVGGSQYAEYKNGKYHYTSSIKWNHKAHDIYIRCSLTKPTVQIGKQKTLIPLSPNGVYGAVMSDTELYLKACHNYKGSDAEAAKKLGYDVKEAHN